MLLICPSLFSCGLAYCPGRRLSGACPALVAVGVYVVLVPALSGSACLLVQVVEYPFITAVLSLSPPPCPGMNAAVMQCFKVLIPSSDFLMRT